MGALHAAPAAGGKGKPKCYRGCYRLLLLLAPFVVIATL
jgi:hypothetical protein